MSQPRQHPGRHSADRGEPEAATPYEQPAYEQQPPFEGAEPVVPTGPEAEQVGPPAPYEPAQHEPTPHEPTQHEPAHADPNQPVKPGLQPVQRTRISGLWIAATAAAVVLLLLLIFILQNNRSVRISYLGFNGNLPLGVALLLAAVLGVLIVAIPGYGRILQLRRAAKRQAAARRKALAPEEDKKHRRGLRR